MGETRFGTAIAETASMIRCRTGASDSSWLSQTVRDSVSFPTRSI